MTQKTLEQFGIVYTETVTTVREKCFIVDEVFSLLFKAYERVEGGLHFESKDALIVNTGLWKVVYRDTDIIGVIIYKRKHGMKMVALAAHEYFRDNAKAVFAYILKKTFSKTWMEVSESAEHYMMKLGAKQFCIENQYAAQLTGKEIVELCEDGFHYKRMINGVLKTKVIIGIPKSWKRE